MASARLAFHWVLALCVGTAFCLYYPALSFDFLSYDDYFYVRDNPHLKAGFSWEALHWAATANLFSVDRAAEYWMPLTLCSRLLDHQLFGIDGGWHHLQGILLHGLNAALVFRVFSVATGAHARSAFVAVLFLLHPLNTEVVCWIALRKDLLCATFGLLTLLSFVHYRQSRRSVFYLLALAAYLAALASKPSAISLPLALLLLDIWPLGRIGLRPFAPRAWAEAIADKLPFLLLAGCVAGLTFVGQQEAGTGNAYWQPTLPQRIGQTLVGTLEYLQRFALPHELSVLYPQQNPALLDWSLVVIAGWVVAGLTVAFAVLAWRGNPAGWAGWIWFLGLLVPVSGLVAFGRQATADRYLYLPMVGLAFALVWCVAEAWREWGSRIAAGTTRTLLGAVSLVLLATFLAFTARVQAMTWKNGFTLWEHAMQVQPDHGFAMHMLGGDYFTIEQLAVGENYFRASIKLEPRDWERRAKLGVVLASHGKPAAALRFLDEAIRENPRELRLHRMLMDCLVRLGRSEEAKRADVRMQLIRLDAFVEQGISMLRAGETELAREQFSLAWAAVAQARRAGPGRAFFREGTTFWNKVVAAIRHRSSTLSKYDAEWFEAVIAYIVTPSTAGQVFDQLTQRYPDEADVWWRLALCRRESGELEQARAAAEKARASTRRSPEAEAEWQRGL